MCGWGMKQTASPNSFGVCFSHMAVKLVSGVIPYYKTVMVFPLNAIISLLVTSVLVHIGRYILGKKSKYLAL